MGASSCYFGMSPDRGQSRGSGGKDQGQGEGGIRGVSECSGNLESGFE